MPIHPNLHISLSHTLQHPKVNLLLDVYKRQDMTREIAPLKQAEDAVLVDSSDMTIAEVVKTIVDLCR